MLQVSIWLLQPYQRDFAQLIGSVVLDEHEPPAENLISVRGIVPARGFPEVFFMPGTLRAENLLRVMADLVERMSPEPSMSRHQLQLEETPEDWHLLLTANKGGLCPLELARLSISPIDSSSTHYAAHWWVRNAMDGKRVVEVAFRQVPTCPSPMLRTLTAAMVQIGTFEEVPELYWADVDNEWSGEVSGGQG